MRLTGICNVRRPTTSNPTNVSLPPRSCSSSSITSTPAHILLAPSPSLSPVFPFLSPSLLLSFPPFPRCHFLFTSFPILAGRFTMEHRTNARYQIARDWKRSFRRKLISVCVCVIICFTRILQLIYNCAFSIIILLCISHFPANLPSRSSPAVCFFYLVFLATLPVLSFSLFLSPSPLFRSLFISRGWRINHIPAREIYFPDI